MKCGKVKNPCKICFQSVSNKNGLQCKGACKKWAHFKCLNYTPGKISDIKAGLIKITCPCPDCTTSEPKEVLTKPPFTCKNEECPATKRPACEVPDCPTKQNPIPSFPPPIPLPHKTESPNQLSRFTPPLRTVPKCPTPPRKSSCPTSPQNASPPRIASPPRKVPCSSSPRKTSPPRSPVTPPTHCPKVSSQQKLAADIFSPQRSQSCSLESPPSCHSGKSHFRVPRSSLSDSVILNSQDQKMLYNAIEQMCNTVGQLSNQLKDFMCKMMNTFQRSQQNRI